MTPASKPFSASAVTDLIGRPYAFGARGSNGPIGCWGLVMEVYRMAGINVFDPLSSHSDCGSQQAEKLSAARAHYAAVLAGESEWVEVSPPPLAGDVALFGSDGAVSHAGVILDDGSVIHTVESAGVIVQPWTRVRSRVMCLVRHVSLDRSQR